MKQSSLDKGFAAMYSIFKEICDQIDLNGNLKLF